MFEMRYSALVAFPPTPRRVQVFIIAILETSGTASHAVLPQHDRDR